MSRQIPEADQNKTTVSVIIPVYNSAAFITDTLDSITGQTGAGTDFSLEIIAVDDGSKYGSADLVRDYVNQTNRRGKEKPTGNYVNREPVVVRLLPNTLRKGAAGARNTGIDAAGGRYISFIDADDKWQSDKLREQLAFMKEKDAAFSFTGYEFADEDCEGIGKIVRVPERISYAQALKNTTVFTSTVMFDMQKLAKDDIYFPYVKSEDTANWWKILKNKGDAYGLDMALALYRRSPGTLSANKIEAVRRIWRLYREVEKLPLIYSMYCFAGYAVRAVRRRV